MSFVVYFFILICNRSANIKAGLRTEIQGFFTTCATSTAADAHFIRGFPGTGKTDITECEKKKKV